MVKWFSLLPLGYQDTQKQHLESFTLFIKEIKQLLGW